jgi:hypothetical protein
MNSRRYYYQQDNQQHGPLPAAQLKTLCAAGQVRATDLVWCEGMPEWVQASTVPELFPPAAPPPPPSTPPAVSCPHCGKPWVKRLAVIWKQGTSDLVTSYGEDVEFTVEAQEAAPPKKKQPGGPLFLGCILAGIPSVIILSLTNNQLSIGGWVLLTCWIALVVTVFAFIGLREARWNREVWPRLYAEWERSWSCQSCGKKFLPEADLKGGDK